MTSEQEIETNFWRAFSRVLGRPVAPGSYTVEQLPEWDSLRHIELVFELEEAFGVSVPQEQIAALYSDTDSVLSFLRQSGQR